MNDKQFQNITNHTTPLHQKQPPNLIRTYTMNLKDSVAPLVIKHNPKKPSSKHMTKKSSKNFMPKYLYNPPYNVEKQKLLFEIEKENMKLRHQHAIKKNLQKKLEKKIISTQKKAESLQKLNKNTTQSIQGLERAITSSLQKAFVLQPNKNYLKSIKSQMQSLNSQIKKNEEAILKIKQSKKYTRYMENEEEKNTFVAELNNMKKYKKKLKLEINKLKRIHQEKKNIRIKELIMEGEIENTVEMENIKIYNIIQDLKERIKEASFKKATMIKRKNVLVHEIEQWKERNGITDEMIDAYYKPNVSVLSMTNSSMGYYRSVNSTQYRSVSNQLNDLGSLREEEEEDESMENHNYQKVKVNGHRANHSENVNLVRENPTGTVKVNSLINSEHANFKGLQCDEKVSEQNLLKTQKDRQAMEKLDQKYFYNEENFESDDEGSGKDYDTEQYDDDEGFEEDDDDDDVEYLMSHGKSNHKEKQETVQKVEDQSKDKQWNNRQSRGISV